jgi:prolyl-tRNA synthetase
MLSLSRKRVGTLFHTQQNRVAFNNASQIRCQHVFRMSRTFAPIQSPKEVKHANENDPTIISHRLLESGGFIAQMSSGFYTILPLGQRVIEKMIRIIDRELFAIDGQKVSMPQVISKDLWDISGRWEQSLDQLFIVTDRKSKKYCLAPTHEECVSFLASNEIRISGKKRLPLLIYQVGNKYRDELRPKNGLMRAKEFLMKDMYSFDENAELAFTTYDRVVEAYKKIFDAFELDHVMVDADTGNIGGTRSHEFQVLSEVGEDEILLCDCSPSKRYAANVEKACGAPPELALSDPFVHIKSQHITVPKDIVHRLINDTKNVQIQYVLVHTTAPDHKNSKPPQIVPVVLGLHREVNVLKIKAKLGAYDVQMSSTEISFDQIGNLMFLDTTAQIEIEYLPTESSQRADVISVHNGDFRIARKGDICANPLNADCKCSPLRQSSGIEVGHVFYLGQKYSKSFKIALQESNNFIEMGCYGIGVSRAMQSVVETNHDNDGIIWPMSIAPFRICIIPMRPARGENMVNRNIFLLTAN